MNVYLIKLTSTRALQIFVGYSDFFFRVLRPLPTFDIHAYWTIYPFLFSSFRPSNS